VSETPPQLARPPLWLLVGISSCGPFALNVFIPSLPRLADTFGASYGTAQLAFTLFLVGVAAGQLVYGPFSDRYGRRPVLLIGLSLGVAGSLACLFALTMEALLVGRFLQAFGSCAGMVLARAIVRDVNTRDTAASALAYVTMGMSLMPMVAPSIGGLLDEHFGWQASFVVILVFVAGVAGAAFLRCPETNHYRLAAVDVGHLVRGWTSLARSPAYLGYTLAMTFNTVSFFCFLVAAPYLTISVLNRPPSEYGFWFVGCALGYLLGNFIAGRWSQRLGLDRMARIGNWLTFPGMIFWFVWANFQEVQIWALFIPMFVNAFANGLAQPNLIAGAVSVNPRLAGSASGLLGCVQMSFGALATVLMGHIQDDTMRPLAFMMLLCCLTSMACHAIAVRAMRAGEPQAI
jgi:DHA1 family bicyclomycin/chloramphenicol resistance-like MFS transporter